MSLPFLISGYSTSNDTCHILFENSILLKGSPPGSKTIVQSELLKLRRPKPAQRVWFTLSALSKPANSLYNPCRGYIFIVVSNWFFRILARLVLLVTRNHFIWLLIQRTQYWNYWGKTINMKWYRSRYFNIKCFSAQWFFIIFPCFSVLKRGDWTCTLSR